MKEFIYRLAFSLGFVFGAFKGIAQCIWVGFDADKIRTVLAGLRK